jgi:hypothetical protein
MFKVGLCPGAKASQPLPPDKSEILGGDKCVMIGQNVFDALATSLWSPNLAGRTDTLANTLTPAYLTALATAADVYAHGVVNPSALCSTKDAASALVAKCLPQYEKPALDAVTDTIVNVCNQGPAGPRSAIAMIIGSVAFAAAAPDDGVCKAPSPQASSGSGSSTDTSAEMGSGTDTGTGSATDTDTDSQTSN